MKKFEYRIKYCTGDASSLYELLDNMTEQGWVVVSHCGVVFEMFSVIFKRELKDA